MITKIKKRVMTTSEAADMLFVHINTVRRWSDKGFLKAYRIGPRGDRRFMHQDIINILYNNRDLYRKS